MFGPRWREIVGTVRPARHRRGGGGRDATRCWRLPRRARRATSTTCPRCAHARAQLTAIDAIDRRFYAIKANAHPAILRALEQEGFGLECVSHGELDACVRDAARAVAGARAVHAQLRAARRVRRRPSRAASPSPWTTSRRCSAGRTCSADATLWLRMDLGRGDGHHAQGQHRRQGIQVRPAGRTAWRSSCDAARRWTCASPACTRTWAAASRPRSTGGR